MRSLQLIAVATRHARQKQARDDFLVWKVYFGFRAIPTFSRDTVILRLADLGLYLSEARDQHKQVMCVALKPRTTVNFAGGRAQKSSSDKVL